MLGLGWLCSLLSLPPAQLLSGASSSPRADSGNVHVVAVVCSSAGARGGSLDCEIIYGDLLDQPVDAVVNAWNRNWVPWWLLLPQGVSGAIKKRGGTAPFRELGRLGAIPLGGAVVTGAGRLPFAGIIHVAGIDLLWRASEWSICESVRNAIAVANARGFERVAFPVIGAGSGGFDEARALALIVRTLRELPETCRVSVVRYRSDLL